MAVIVIILNSVFVLVQRATRRTDETDNGDVSALDKLIRELINPRI